MVLGSAHLFSDQYLEKEENGKLQEVLWQLMTSDDITLNPIDAEDPEVRLLTTPPFLWPHPSQVSDYQFLPETGQSAEKVQSCLQESEEVWPHTLFPRVLVVPLLICCRCREISHLLSTTLSLDWTCQSSPTACCESVISWSSFSPTLLCRAYSDLGLKHETLTLIQPTFETPLPPLQPALFPPSLHEPPSPSLDLFDLDEEFSSERTRVAQITNKCRSHLSIYGPTLPSLWQQVQMKIWNTMCGSVVTLWGCRHGY